MYKRGLSVVIPTFNESGNIDQLIKRTVRALRDAGIRYEIIFVDDHSKDATRSRISRHTKSYPIFLLVKEGRIGKGYSILEGARVAKFSHIAMLYADPRGNQAYGNHLTDTFLRTADRNTDKRWRQWR